MTCYPANEGIQRNGVSAFHTFDLAEREDDDFLEQIVPPVVEAMTRHPGNGEIQTQASEILRSTVRVAPRLCAYMRVHLENEEIQRGCLNVLVGIEDAYVGYGDLEEEQLTGRQFQGLW